MSNPTELLPRTSIAAVAYRGTAKNYINVYTQDVNGGIRESRYNGQSWSGGTDSDQDLITKPDNIPKPKLYSPLSAITVNNGKSIRVFYLTADNLVQELCQDNDNGKWYPGDLNKKPFQASSVSRLAAIGQSKYNYISVYYQRPDGAIGEVKRTAAGWTDGDSFGDKPLIGTGLAAVTVRGASDTGIHVFYQTADGTLAEAVHDDGSNWAKGDLSKLDMGAAATNLTALAYGNTQNPMAQLYFVGKTNTITEVGYYSGKWKDGQNHPGRALSVPGSDIAVVIVEDPEHPEQANNLKYFIQDDENQVQEYHWRKGWPWNEWRKSSIIPTGNLQ